MTKKVQIEIDEELLNIYKSLEKDIKNNPKINDVIKFKLHNLSPQTVFILGLDAMENLYKVGKAALISQETGKSVDVITSVDGSNKINTKIKDGSN